MVIMLFPHQSQNAKLTRAQLCLRKYSKQVGDPDHLKVFANADAAATWFEENDPEGVAFEYGVQE